ncbi:30S ribosomal protein S13 [Candidatus Saganbacteria bacterium CG08_land_8_20_14_0_20_45_16]|uniref:Small ribosomal subunit protein uS13 n=1 Tax=Candidatus Saganbacteria bacterium CG08_land_8_20_14_0_20_45_16 TaxID=2014293 RepID=A0A2H0XXG5_UNCSA|nr:MAG: 30S ribosomal protein S13 [Candidatus Saganbacteria bacterium CG08_land_8_20_14_0_20_45_16]
MARIVGVELPPNKNIRIALTYIYGIGTTLSGQILTEAGIDLTRKVKELNDAEVLAIREAIKRCSVEGDLRKEISMNVKRLIEIGTYRGARHRKNLPARGQRTRTNSRTRRGKRQTVGSGRKKEEKT